MDEEETDEVKFIGDKKKLKRRMERQHWFESWNDRSCNPVEDDAEDDVEQ